MRDSRTLRALRRAYVASARQAPVRVHVRRRAPEVYERDLPGVLQVPHVRENTLRHADPSGRDETHAAGMHCVRQTAVIIQRSGWTGPLHVSVALAQVS